MSSEEFQRLSDNCKPSELYNPEWSIYYPLGFANDLLPAVKLRTAKAMNVYDGAELFTDTVKTERKLYQLTDSKYLISLIGFTYTKGAEAEKQRKNVIVSDHEVCVFMEVAQDDSIEVFFKLGRDFKEFLHSYSKQSKKPINPTVVESTTYKTSIKDLQAVFNKKLVHYNMMVFVLKTIGINESKTLQNNYTLKLNRLLRINKIKRAKYTNVFGNNEKKQKHTIVIAPTENEGLDLSLESGKQAIDLDKSQSSIAFLYEGAKNYVVHETAEAKPNPTPAAITNDTGKPAIDNEVAKQIYGDAQKTGLSDIPKPPQQEQTEFSFADFVQQLNEQSQKAFYKNVKLQIRVVQLSENATTKFQPVDQPKTAQLKQPPQITNKAIIQNYEDWDVGLDVVIDEKGKVSVKHRVSSNYLKESKYWTQEIKARGLDEEIKIEDLRRQIATDFVAPETEESFSQKFLATVEEIKQIPAVQKALQKISAATSKAVIAYVEGVQATQKVVKNVWDEGTINESLWWQNKYKEEYKEWPVYMHPHPLAGGVIDGVIDEVVGIPIAIKGVYEIVTDPEKIKGLKALFTKEGAKNLYDSFVKDAVETYHDSEKGEHFVGQTTVAVASMLSGSGFITKIDDVEKLGAKASKNFIEQESKDVTKVAGEIRNEFLKKVPSKKIMQDFLKGLDKAALKELFEELAEDTDLLKFLKSEPAKFVLGKKLETAVSNLFETELKAGTGEFLEKFAAKAGVSVSELVEMKHIKQLQLYLKEGFTVVDDAFVKEIRNADDIVTGFEIIVNETKLSKLAPPTTRQTQFIAEKAGELIVRSTKPDAIKIFNKKGVKVTIKKYVKAVGDGTEDASKIIFE